MWQKNIEVLKVQSVSHLKQKIKSIFRKTDFFLLAISSPFQFFSQIQKSKIDKWNDHFHFAIDFCKNILRQFTIDSWESKVRASNIVTSVQLGSEFAIQSSNISIWFAWLKTDLLFHHHHHPWSQRLIIHWLI